MKKTLLVTSIISLAVLTGCTTKYYEKCNSKLGVCEKNLTTNSSSVARDIIAGNKNPCEDAACAKPVVAPKTAVKTTKAEKININIIVKTQPSTPSCNINTDGLVDSNIDNY